MVWKRSSKEQRGGRFKPGEEGSHRGEEQICKGDAVKDVEECVRVFVCVCVREREERGQGGQSGFKGDPEGAEEVTGGELGGV